MKVKSTIELTAEDVTHALAFYLSQKGLMLQDQPFDAHYRFVKINGEEVFAVTLEIM